MKRLFHSNTDEDADGFKIISPILSGCSGKKFSSLFVRHLHAEMLF
jgi:hypothetical protein